MQRYRLWSSMKGGKNKVLLWVISNLVTYLVSADHLQGQVNSLQDLRHVPAVRSCRRDAWLLFLFWFYYLHLLHLIDGVLFWKAAEEESGVRSFLGFLQFKMWLWGFCESAFHMRAVDQDYIPVKLCLVTWCRTCRFSKTFVRANPEAPKTLCVLFFFWNLHNSHTVLGV